MKLVCNFVNMKVKLTEALIEFNKAYHHAGEKMTQRLFGEKYYEVNQMTNSQKSTISRMFAGKVAIVDVPKSASILRTSCDFLLGTTDVYQPCVCE